MSTKWRCTKCQALLGEQKGSRLHVRYKQMQYFFAASDYVATTVCRRCSTLNEKREGATAA